MGHKRSLQLTSEHHISTATVPDNTGTAEVGGKPGEGGGTFKTPAFRRSGCRRLAEVVTIERPLFTNQRGLKRQHQAGLSEPSMQPIRQLISRHEGLEFRNSTPEKTGKDGHRRGLNRQFSGSGLQQTDLTAMGVEQHQSLHTLVRELLTNFLNKPNQQFGTEAECSWKAAMFR